MGEKKISAGIASEWLGLNLVDFAGLETRTFH